MTTKETSRPTNVNPHFATVRLIERRLSGELRERQVPTLRMQHEAETVAREYRERINRVRQSVDDIKSIFGEVA